MIPLTIFWGFVHFVTEWSTAFFASLSKCLITEKLLHKYYFIEMFCSGTLSLTMIWCLLGSYIIWDKCVVASDYFLIFRKTLKWITDKYPSHNTLFTYLSKCYDMVKLYYSRSLCSCVIATLTYSVISNCKTVISIGYHVKPDIIVFQNCCISNSL